MTRSSEDAELIDLMVAQEERMAALYGAYARLFPAHEPFWSELAQEETLHAHWIRRLYARACTGTGRVRADRLNPTTLRTQIERVEGLLAACGACPPSLDEALRAALNLERTVCEARYFEVFEGLSEWAEFKQVQLCLAEALDHHVGSIRAYLERVEAS